MSSTFKFAFSKRALHDDKDEEWTELDHPTQSPPRSPPLMPLSLKRARRPSKLNDHAPDVLDSSPACSPYSMPHYSASLPSRHRPGILSAASDALGFRKKTPPIPRKKPGVPHTPDIMPGVIEINAHNNSPSTSSSHRDCELEERERLRDVAAQSIGLDPELLHSSKPDTNSFLDSPQSPSRLVPIPPFPATLSALRPFTELSAALPKFAPPSSLLVYALARQWKLRTIVLTSHPPSQQTHVHLFKGASKDEREIERLRVTEDSLIYVAEEEVGGRRNVVKFAGKNVSSGPTTGESSRSMWFLHIRDPTESHRWIAAIKNAVLAQRAARAGVDIPAQLDGGNEPKGDMDVMLSMHLQRTMLTGPLKPLSANTSPSQLITTSPSPSPSLHSLRINTSSPSPTAITKGIFSGTRSRSPSVDGSPTLTYPPGHAEDSFSAAGTSLLTMIRDKPSTDSGFSPSHSLPLSLSHVPREGSPAPSLRSSNSPVIISASDLKISRERDTPDVTPAALEVSSSTPPGSDTPLPPFFSPSPRSALTVSLQPPPRKSKQAVMSHPVPVSHESRGIYSQPRSNSSVAGDFGIPSGDPGDFTPRATSPISPETSNPLNGQLEPLVSNSCSGVSASAIEAHEREKGAEIARNLLENGNASHSSFGSGSVPIDKLPQNTVISKRWSRQGVPLPKQPTPPTGPPPSIPPSPEANIHRISMESSISIPGTYTVDRSPSSSSSNFNYQGQLSARSASSLSPVFWKRASSSSTYSASSISTSDSRGQSQLRMPIGGEPLSSSVGSVVSNGTSLRPTSLSVHSSSPVVHIGATKRRSMPPPRPAPNFAPPPAPVQESVSEPVPLATPTPPPQKSFRSSVAQRALRLSLTSPKPPPSTALPPRPDEDPSVQDHRRNPSSGTSDAPTSSSRSASPLFRNATPVQRTSSPSKSLSIRQRLRILSTPPVQSSPALIPPNQVSTLDLSDDNSDDPPTPYCYSHAQPTGLGEHILKDEEDPSFLQLGTPITPTVPKPPPRSPFRPISPPAGMLKTSDWWTPPLEPGCDFIALSPPPPRRSSKPHVVPVMRPEKLDVERSEFAEQRGSVVSLGFVTT